MSREFSAIDWQQNGDSVLNGSEITIQTENRITNHYYNLTPELRKDYADRLHPKWQDLVSSYAHDGTKYIPTPKTRELFEVVKAQQIQPFVLKKELLNGNSATHAKTEDFESRKTEISVRESNPSAQESELIVPVDFPLHALNKFQRHIVEATAEVYQIKPALPGMASVATLAGAIGKSYVVAGAVNGRLTHCNVFVLAGAPKSYGKGATGIIASPMIAASNAMAENFKLNERPGLVQEQRVLEKKTANIVNLLANVRKKESEALSDNDREEWKKELVEIQTRLDEISPQVKLLPSYWISSTTSAAFVDFLVRNGDTMFSYAAEGGELVRIALGKFTKDNAADFDLLLSGYTVEPYRETRISRGDNLLTPCISVLWFCQPMLLREIVSNEEALERGLTARMNLFIADHEGNIPEDDGIIRSVSEQARSDWDRMILRALATRGGEFKQIQCSEGAREVFRAFHNEGVKLRNGKYRDVEGELGRWRENAIRLAAGQCVADLLTGIGSADVLTEEHAKRGVELAKWAAHSTLGILNAGRSERRLKRTQKLVELVTVHGGSLTLRDLKNRHSFIPEEIKGLATEFPHMLCIDVDKPKTGRPSEVLKISTRRQ